MIEVAKLRHLAQHLRTGKLGHKRFDFNCFNAEEVLPRDGDEAPCTATVSEGTCGTNGCAIGELPILFPEQWKFGKRGLPTLANYLFKWIDSYDVFGMAGTFFAISPAAADHLFSPERQETAKFGGKFLDWGASKEEVADNIDAFCDLAEAGKLP